MPKIVAKMPRIVGILTFISKINTTAESQMHYVVSLRKTIINMTITDTTLELSVFWPSDTESRINELRFSESISLSFKTRLTSVTCFCDDVT